MSIDLFDASYYQVANPDLAQAGLTTEAQLRNHFETIGLNEGRVFSPFVNLSVYYASNKDLQAAGLITNQQLFTHLQNHGVAEGRKFSQFADINFYLQSNNDINQFFQGNREQAFQHLKNNGVKEGRLFSSLVDLNLYRDLNSDLKSLDNSQALQHLEIFGVREGRQFSYPLDLNYYDLNNPDLLTYYAGSKNLSTEAVFNNPAELSSYNQFLFWHFATYGIPEGRRSSDEFDVNYYRSANQDLAGFSNKQLYDHFRNFGINELRPLSDSYDAEYYSQTSLADDIFNLTPAELFKYYITAGIEQGDYAVANPKPPNEVVSEFDLVSGNGTISGNLNPGDRANLDRKGSYSEEYLLSGLDPGQQVQLNLTAAYDTHLQLVDLVTGDVIVENDNISATNANSGINFTVEPGIQYMVRVSSDNASAVGAFTLSGQASSTIVGTLAANGGNLSETLTNTDLPDPDELGAFKRDYRLDLTGVNPGQELKIALNSSNFDTYLELINADTKEFIDSNDDIDDETTDSELNFVVESGINYAVRVTSYDEQQTGSFSLTSTLEAGDDSQIDRDEIITGTFTPDGDPNQTDIHALKDVNPGEQIRINVESETFDNSVQLLANGIPISSNDDANGETDSELTFTAQANTIYQIQVNRSDKDRAGDGHYTMTTTPLTGQGSTVTLGDPGMQSLLANKTTLGRADVLAFFNQAKADGTVSVQEQRDLKELAREAVAFRIPDSVKFLLTKVNDAIDPKGQNPTPIATNVLEGAVDKWFYGKGLPQPLYVGAGDTARGQAPTFPHPVNYLKTEGSLYSANGEARIRDINQGGLEGLGDCAFLAALGATFTTPQSEGRENQTSSIINKMIEDNGDGTYTFRFFEKGQPFYVTVDGTLPTTNETNLLAPDETSYFKVGLDKNIIAFANKGGLGKEESVGYSVNGTPSSRNLMLNSRQLLTSSDATIWGPLAEKAYALFRESTAGKTDKTGYSLIGNGDSTLAPLERITGQKGKLFDPTKGEVTFDQITNALSKGQAISVGTLESKLLKTVPEIDGITLENLLPASHAYSLTHAYLDGGGTQRVVVRNPWGSDGGSIASGDPNDGFIDLTFNQLKGAFDELAIV